MIARAHLKPVLIALSLLSVYFLILPSSLSAEEKSLLTEFPVSLTLNEVVTFKPIKAHHFSSEAPQSCGTGQLIDRAVRFVKCQFVESGTTEVDLNVCDDKLTYCKPIHFTVTVLPSSQLGDQAQLTKNQNLNAKVKHLLVPGFEFGTPDEMVHKAAEEERPVFVMISTDWCPPCNQAKEHLLRSKRFQEVSRGWFKIYVDGDSLAAKAWAKIIPYHYFPSFVLLTPGFQEVARFTDETREEAFAKWASASVAKIKDPIQRLRERVLARIHPSLILKLREYLKGVSKDEAYQDRLRLLKWALDMQDNSLTSQLIAIGTYPELAAEITSFEINQLSEQEARTGVDDKKAHVALYQLLLKQLINKDGWSQYLADFCDYDSKACAPEIGQIDERMAALDAIPGLTDQERTTQLGEEYENLISVFDLLKLPKRKKEAAQKCTTRFKELMRPADKHQDQDPDQDPTQLSRSGSQGLISCLVAGGDLKQAEALIHPLIEAYPTEPTFVQTLARVLLKQKRAKEALVWINKAEVLSYGFNFFRVQLTKVDILFELKRRKEALKVVQGAIDQLTLDSAADSSSQSFMNRFRQLQIKVQGLKKI